MNLQKTVERYTRELNNLKEISESYNYVKKLQGRTFTHHLLMNSQGAFYNPRFKSSKRYSLVIIFSMTDCSICLKSELSMMDSYNRSFSGKESSFEIVAIAYAEGEQILGRFKRAGDYSFPIVLDATDLVRNNLSLTKTPVSVLVDNSSQKILLAHQPAESIPELSVNFLKAIDRFID